MRVIYVKPIALKLAEAIDDAAAEDKRIEKIVLTKAEHDELVVYMRRTANRIWGMERAPDLRDVRLYKGVRIEVEGA